MTGDHSGRNIEFHRRYNPEDSPSNQIISTVQTHRYRYLYFIDTIILKYLKQIKSSAIKHKKVYHAYAYFGSFFRFLLTYNLISSRL